MKKNIYALALITLTACTGLSETSSSITDSEAMDSLKVGVVQAVYQNVARGTEEVVALHSFATPKFKSALEQFYSVSEKNENCTEAIYQIHIVEGNGYGVEEAINANFIVNKQNGNVISHLMMPDGNQSVVQFAMQCENDYCLIDNVIDKNGKHSAIESIQMLCPIR